MFQARPTPAHLTSAQAEQILASACENEAHNAKRMRLGLEPVGQPMPLLPGVSIFVVNHSNYVMSMIIKEVGWGCGYWLKRRFGLNHKSSSEISKKIRQPITVKKKVLKW